MTVFEDLSGPHIHLHQLDPSSTVARALYVPRHGEVVRVLRGSKMTTDHKLFDEVGAAFQFPDYFGENWNAFRDCLGDLEWMPAQRYVILVTSVESMLVAAPDVFQHFVIAVSDVAREWAKAGIRPWAPEPRPFHVVLRTKDRLAELTQLLESIAIEFDHQAWPLVSLGNA